MCRLAAYVGPPRTLHSLWLAPEHSLEVQSYAPREMKTAVLNADGFGMSWYSDAEDGPARYRTILPLWADENVRSMSKHLVTRCAVANVRSATVGMPVQLSNVSPFVEGRWTFTHNGFLRAFHPRFARKIRESLDDARYGSIVGNTDSEHLFAHLMTRLAGHDSDPTGIVADWIGEVAAMATEKALLNVIVTGGHAGLGLETTRALARAGASLTVGSRDPARQRSKHCWPAAPAWLPGIGRTMPAPRSKGGWRLPIRSKAI